MGGQMDEMEDDVDELALDHPETPYHANRQLGASNRRSTGTVARCIVQDTSHSTHPNQPTTQTPPSNMSSGRYPKRRRVSERESEATSPIVPTWPSTSQKGETQARGDSSPDELAPSSPHTTTRSNRTNPRPKRAVKNRKKSLPEIQKATASPRADKPDPGDLSTGAAAPEASDDELNVTVVAADHHANGDKDETAVATVKDEEDRPDEKATSALDLHIHDHLDEDKPVASPLEDAIGPEYASIMSSNKTPEAIIAVAPAVGDTAENDTTAAQSVDTVPGDSSMTKPPVEDAVEDSNVEVSFAEEVHEEQRILTPEPVADHPFEHALSQPSIEEPPQFEVPPLRRRSTFKGSFLRVSPPASPERYVSKSPPPYSRVSTPVATPRELPPAPPQFVPYKEKMVLRGHRRPVSAVKFSPDGLLLASCSGDATIKIWETTTGKLRNTLEGHLAGVNIIAWMPDCKVIASGSDDKSIRLWYVETGKMHPRQLIGHSSYVFSLAFSPKGNMLASGSYDEALFLWDVRTQRLMRSHPAHSDPIGAVDFVFDGTLIVSCSSDGLIRLWDTASGQCLRTLVHEDNAAVTNVCFVPNGKFVLAWTLDSSIRCWNYVDGRCKKTFQGHKNEQYSLAGAHGEYTNKDETERRAFVASGSEDGKIYTWDVNSKEILQVIEGHEGVVLGVDTLKKEDLNLMVSCGMDGTVRIWEKEKGEVEVQDAAATIDGEDPMMKDSEGQEASIDAGKEADAIADQQAVDDAEFIVPGFEFIEENVEVATEPDMVDGVET